MGDLQQLGYAVFEVSDLSAWERFVGRGLGLELLVADGGFSARLDARAARLFVHAGESDDVAAPGFEPRSHEALDDIATRLNAAGVRAEEGTPARCRARRVERLVHFREPGGITCEVYVSPEMASVPFVPADGSTGFVADEQGFGHVAIRANDMAASERFFCDLLGARLSDRIRCRIGDVDIDITFLHLGARHHSIALGAGLPKHIHHFMLQRRDFADVGRTLDRLSDAGTPVVQTLGQHPNDKMVSFYAATPSGFQVEVGWGGRTIGPGWTPEVHSIWTEWGHRPPSSLLTRKQR